MGGSTPPSSSKRHTPLAPVCNPHIMLPSSGGHIPPADRAPGPGHEKQSVHANTTRPSATSCSLRRVATSRLLAEPQVSDMRGQEGAPLDGFLVLEVGVFLGLEVVGVQVGVV